MLKRRSWVAIGGLGFIAFVLSLSGLNAFLVRNPDETEHLNFLVSAFGVGATVFLGAAALWLADAGNRNARQMHEETVRREERDKRLSVATDLTTWGTNAAFAILGGTRDFLEIERDPRGFELESRVQDLGQDDAVSVFFWLRLLQHDLVRQMEVLTTEEDQSRVAWRARADIFRLIAMWRENPSSTAGKFAEDIARWNDPGQGPKPAE